MKKFFLIIGILIISLVYFTACGPKADPESDFEVSPMDGGSAVVITSYLGNKWEVVIPARIRKLPVTHIGDDAFAEKDLVSVTIPNSVTHIWDGAFSKNQLTNITIPNSVTHLNGFSGNQLSNITFPDGVITIGERAFSNNQLTSITIPENVIEIGEFAFSGNLLTEITISNGVTYIGDGVFFRNQLTSVIIPESVTYIGDGVFFGNPLTSITIGADVKMEYNYVDMEYRYIMGSYGFFPNFYNSTGKRAGTYTFSNNQWSFSAVATEQGSSELSTENTVSSQQSQADLAFPSTHIGTWKRNEYPNILTISTNTITISSRTHTWNLLGSSGNSFTLKRDGAGEFNATIRFTNNSLEIGDTGNTGQENWMGTWLRQ